MAITNRAHFNFTIANGNAFGSHHFEVLTSDKPAFRGKMGVTHSMWRGKAVWVEGTDAKTVLQKWVAKNWGKNIGMVFSKPQ